MKELVLGVLNAIGTFPFFEFEFNLLMFTFVLVVFAINFALPLLSSQRYEEESPEVPEASSAWTVRRDSLWIRWYRCFWHRWPRDICSYFWLSLVLGILSVVDVISAVMLLLFVISVSFWIMDLIIHMIGSIVSSLFAILIGFPAFMMVFFQGIGSIAVNVGSLPATYKIGAGILLFFLIRKCWKSNAGKVTRLWVKARKQKYCPRIRVI